MTSMYGDSYAEPCDCGFDHEVEPEEAREWHQNNPCPYCVYEFGIGHGPNCLIALGEEID